MWYARESIVGNHDSPRFLLCRVRPLVCVLLQREISMGDARQSNMWVHKMRIVAAIPH